MTREIERRAPKRGRATAVVVTAVGLSLLTMFGALYALTPETVITVEDRAPEDRP